MTAPAIHIPSILEDLRTVGITDADIRRHCGIKSKGAVSAWRNGDKRPSLSPGIRLLLLHARHFPQRSPLKV